MRHCETLIRGDFLITRRRQQLYESACRKPDEDLLTPRAVGELRSRSHGISAGHLCPQFQAETTKRFAWRSARIYLLFDYRKHELCNSICCWTFFVKMDQMWVPISRGCLLSIPRHFWVIPAKQKKETTKQNAFHHTSRNMSRKS